MPRVPVLPHGIRVSRAWLLQGTSSRFSDMVHETDTIDLRLLETKEMSRLLHATRVSMGLADLFFQWCASALELFGSV